MSEETKQETADQQAGNQAGGNQQQEQTGTDSQRQSEDKSFTQDDVNNLVARETKKQQEKLLKQLGVGDFKDAKEGMAKLKEFQDAQKTDVEKQAEAAKALEVEKKTLTEQNATLQAEVGAMKAGVKADSVSDVVTLAKTLVTDDVDMDTAIKQVVDKYPHFAQEQRKVESKPSFTTGQHGTGSGITKEDFSKMKYKDRIKLKQENPTEYNSLVGK